MTPDIVPLEGMRFMEEIDRLALLTESLKMARGIHAKLEVLECGS